jgi:hypothetical protein
MPEPILLLNRRRSRHHVKNKKRRKYARRARKQNRRRSPGALRRYRYRAKHRGHQINRKRSRRRPFRTNRSYRRRARSYRTNRRYRRNPRTLGARGMRGLTHWIGPVVTGAAGGVVLDLAWGQLSSRVSFLSQYQTGWAAYFAKLGVLVGGAWVINRFLLKSPAQRIIVKRAVLGGATVITYGAMRGLAQQFLPSMPGLSGYMDFHSYGLGGYMPRTATPMMLGSLQDLYSPAAVIQPAGTPVPRQFGGYIAAQPGGLSGYMQPQPHMVGAGLGCYDWHNDGM